MPPKKENEARVNNEIRVSRVRVINTDGEPLGILPIGEAISRALAAGLDLVEVAPNADPPVCRIMDFGKFKYEKSKKAKEAKKKQHVMHLKEIKLHPKTEDHEVRTVGNPYGVGPAAGYLSRLSGSHAVTVFARKP